MEMKHCFGNSPIFFGVYYLWTQFHTYVDILEANGDVVIRSFGIEKTKTLLAKKLLIIHLASDLLDTLRHTPIENSHLFDSVVKSWLSIEELDSCITRLHVAEVLVRFDQDTMSFCQELLAVPNTELSTSRFLLLTVKQASQSIETLTAKQ